jgi:predicted lactoylglutathione lyase
MAVEVTLDQINVVVSDLPTTVAFLEALGVAFSEMTMPEWLQHHRTIESTADGLDADLDSSAFAAYWGGVPADWTGVVVTLRTPSRAAVDELFERAAASGATALRPPHDAFWGSRAAFIGAPGGIVVGLVSPGDAEHHTAPPDPTSLPTAD